MELVVVKQEDINKHVLDLEIENNGYDLFIFKGFYYFSYSNIYYDSYDEYDKQEKPFYILSYDKKDLVGVMKVSNYERDGFGFWAINYVDIRDDYKNKGIATSLYRKLNEEMRLYRSSSVIVGSDISDEGEQVGIRELRKRELKDVLNFDSENDYIIYLKGEGLL